ncbi:hypothetical protein [Pseudomonas guariconensis]|uniref:hypothetical protein n=1 Tax=Pseudomonas guariconensis TaxID=1288410 RepID=UPI0018AC16B6|nr:hypothetical protein [Pseudomonas guariconensis]MBF8722158.1 hypothetical protein [Pseudomonas guariconensis]
MFNDNDFAAPVIPALEGGESLDLGALEGKDLEVLFTYAHINVGDYYQVRFHARTAGEQTVDVKKVEKIERLDERNYARTTISIETLSQCSGGWAFVSIGQDTGFGEITSESGLQFFYVDKAVAKVRALPPAQLIGHDRTIDLGRTFGDVVVQTGPYPAMASGDQVTLTWQGVTEHSEPLGPVSLQRAIGREDIGKPLSWALDGNELRLADNGQGELYYSIEYADSLARSESPRQSVRIAHGVPEAPRLDKPSIEGLSGDRLEPDDYPDGAVVRIEDYGMQLDDEIVLHARGRERVTQAVRVDVSILQSGKIRFGLPHGWLKANAGGRVTLGYQWSRPDASGISESLSLVVGQEPVLLFVTIAAAVSEGDGKGRLTPRRAFDVSIPAEVSVSMSTMFAVNQLGIRYEAHKRGEKQFQFPLEVVSANLGQRLEIFYSNLQDAGTIEYSKAYDLGIENYNSFKAIRCPVAADGRLSLKGMNEQGAKLELLSWQFCGVAQPVRIDVVGKAKEGGQLLVQKVRNDVALTSEEYRAGKVEATLSKQFLERLKLNENFQIRVAVSFDEGRSFKAFPTLVLTLVA